MMIYEFNSMLHANVKIQVYQELDDLDTSEGVAVVFLKDNVPYFRHAMMVSRKEFWNDSKRIEI